MSEKNSIQRQRLNDKKELLSKKIGSSGTLVDNASKFWNETFHSLSDNFCGNKGFSLDREKNIDIESTTTTNPYDSIFKENTEIDYGVTDLPPYSQFINQGYNFIPESDSRTSMAMAVQGNRSYSNNLTQGGANISQEEVERILQNSKKVWTKEEDERLMKLSNTTKNWKNLSTIIGTKTPQQCYYRFNKLQSLKKSKKWTRQEEIKLIELIDKYGKNWDLLAKFLERSADEICDRYSKKLDPKLKRSSFTKEEDELIIKLHEMYGHNWVEISKFFDNRDISMLKNRYYSHIRKFIKNPSKKSSETTFTAGTNGCYEEVDNCSVKSIPSSTNVFDLSRKHSQKDSRLGSLSYSTQEQINDFERFFIEDHPQYCYKNKTQTNGQIICDCSSQQPNYDFYNADNKTANEILNLNTDTIFEEENHCNTCRDPELMTSLQNSIDIFFNSYESKDNEIPSAIIQRFLEPNSASIDSQFEFKKVPSIILDIPEQNVITNANSTCQKVPNHENIKIEHKKTFPQVSDISLFKQEIDSAFLEMYYKTFKLISPKSFSAEIKFKQ